MSRRQILCFGAVLLFGFLGYGFGLVSSIIELHMLWACYFSVFTAFMFAGLVWVKWALKELKQQEDDKS